MRRFAAIAVIQYRDRRTGRLEPECVFHGQALAFLYENRAGLVLASFLTANGLFSRGYGWLQRRPASRRKIPRFISGLGIDAREAERPPGEYASLDEFFTRRLKAGSRPINQDPERLITPADGRIRVFPRLRDPLLEVKGSTVRLEDLLGRGPPERHKFGRNKPTFARVPRLVGLGHGAEIFAQAPGVAGNQAKGLQRFRKIEIEEAGAGGCRTERPASSGGVKTIFIVSRGDGFCDFALHFHAQVIRRHPFFSTDSALFRKRKERRQNGNCRMRQQSVHAVLCGGKLRIVEVVGVNGDAVYKRGKSRRSFLRCADN